jgi:putative nucleotidyltransferase with HDIG domain
MSLDPTHAEQEAAARTLERERAGMSPREIIGAGLGALIFFAVQAVLLVLAPPHVVHVVPVVLCLVVFVLASRVRLDLPFGFTVLSQLALVPLLFAAPAALVPALACVAFTASALFEVARGQLRLGRLITQPANSCFALGPAAVFVLAQRSPQAAGPLLLLAALGAEFALDFAVCLLRDAVTLRVSLRAQLSDCWVYGVDAGLSCVALVVARDVVRSPVAVLSLLPLLGVLGVFARERRRRIESVVELGNAYRGTALVLGDVVEADDGYTGEHCRSVVGLALAVGEDLGLSPDRLRNLEFAALLHDVGKIAIPKDIINKPGRLSPEEWVLIKTHTIEGQRMLDRVGGFMREVGRIVRAHHERWDGHGYPDGVAGQDIPLEARIIAACDAWNAMRTDRAYRQALSYEAAMAELSSCSGTQFDPKVLSSLIKVVALELPRPGEPASRRQLKGILEDAPGSPVTA